MMLSNLTPKIITFSSLYCFFRCCQNMFNAKREAEFAKPKCKQKKMKAYCTFVTVSVKCLLLSIIFIGLKNFSHFHMKGVNKCFAEIQICRQAVNFINILRTNFSYECHFGSFFCVHVTREKLRKAFLYEKGSGKMLMKLTPYERLEIGLAFEPLLHQFSCHVISQIK